jgi:hypothetical protein
VVAPGGLVRSAAVIRRREIQSDLRRVSARQM